MKQKKTSIPNVFKPLLKYISLVSSAKRIGALNILKAPSRFGHALFYPDGRIIKDPPQ